jgi:hypothetical protein
MGTWGTGWFDNDAAADFVGDVEDAKPSARPGLIAARLQAVAEQGGYIEGPEADEGLAAAALVAAASGAGSGVAKKVKVARTLPAPDAVTLTLAESVVTRLSSPTDNEWLELWSEAGEGEAALVRLSALQLALAAVVPATGARPWAAAPRGAPPQKRRWWKR